ncbi:MAG: aminotransferase class V-fold PLP-dependent enzyme, partial [Gammaproteobacteria bacterium]|nr:aminotransferase class V-fold PLP-dependent enzyme [Gammaproteobacteria bacterium]
RIYFENAGGTLKLRSIFKPLGEFTALPDNAGRRNAASQEVNEAIINGRRDIALFLGATSGIIAAEQSTTGMIFRILNTIAQNIKGRSIVTSNLDHASVYDATRTIADRHGMEFRVAQLDRQTGVVPVASVVEQVDDQTAAVTIIHSSNIMGTRNDAVALVKEIRKRNPNTYIILDGAQHASHGRIDVEEFGADAYIFVPYKTYSKVGTSFAHLSKRLANLPHDNVLGKPGDFWDLGTREAAAYACMSKVVEYMQWLGAHFTDSSDPRGRILEAMHAIEQYEESMLNGLLHGTSEAEGMLSLEGVTLYGQTQDLSTREAIVAFNVKGHNTAEVVDLFGQQGIRLHNRISDAYSKHTLSAMGIEECIRVSLCHYNSLEEMNAFLKALKEIAQ